MCLLKFNHYKCKIFLTYLFNFFSLIIALNLLQSCDSNKSLKNKTKEKNNVKTINYTVVNSFPHDTTSFTEGLLIHDGQMYESTGSPQDLPQCQSVFGPVNIDNGRIDIKITLEKSRYFGEGTVIFHDKIYQLTYNNQLCFVYNFRTFKKIKEYSYSSKEGWGLTHDSLNIVMSDGTNNLIFMDENFQPVKKVAVTMSEEPIADINELEFINGYVYANIWKTNYILKIDPNSGKVVGKIDLTSLYHDSKSVYPNTMEMNGIAYDPESDKIYITGKLWPKLYQIQFSH